MTPTEITAIIEVLKIKKALIVAELKQGLGQVVVMVPPKYVNMIDDAIMGALVTGMKYTIEYQKGKK